VPAPIDKTITLRICDNPDSDAWLETCKNTRRLLIPSTAFSVQVVESHLQVTRWSPLPSTVDNAENTGISSLIGVALSSALEKNTTPNHNIRVDLIESKVWLEPPAKPKPRPTTVEASVCVCVFGAVPLPFPVSNSHCNPKKRPRVFCVSAEQQEEAAV